MAKLKFPVVKKYFDNSIGTPVAVVSYDALRFILFKMKMVARRDGDWLMVWPADELELNFWANRNDYKDETCVAKFYIDEGHYTGCLSREGEELKIELINPQWSEVVDFLSVLAFITRRLKPDFQPAPSPFIGRGFTADHFLGEYRKALNGLENDLFEFYETERD